MNSLSTPDILVFLLYFLVIAIYGYWIYNRKKKATSDTKEFFLAEGSLTWWAIGASLIASNISAEQFIGMSGDGFTLGLAISSYEWMAAATLIVVAVFFIPVYLKNKIYTMPQFLHQRYNGTVAMIMAIFWLLLYIIVNLTSILFLGALAINSISGIDITVCMIFLAVFAIFITAGGMKVIGYTDVIQVFFLILGGLITTYLALNLVGDHFGTPGAIGGLKTLHKEANSHFHMIFSKDNPFYSSLPGISVLIGGMWIANLNYWGCNQYITQRALGADIKTARNGLLFAAFLKLLMPVIVVLPGIAAYLLHRENIQIGETTMQAAMMADGVASKDRAYPTLLNLLGPGLKGMAFAALTAAIVASLAGKANSIATIFTLDLYKKKIKPNATEQEQVKVGRIAIVISLLVAVLIAPFLGIGGKGGFEFIQEYTGFVSPGIFAMFLLGFFWKKASSNAALFATIGGFILSVIFKILPQFVNLEFLYPIGFAVSNKDGVYEIPFLDRMAFVFLLSVAGMIIISLYDYKRGKTTRPMEIDTKMMFNLHPSFVIGSLIVLGILAALYTVFW